MRDKEDWNAKQKVCGAWLEALGHPEQGKKIIHIVGTNGKGSTGRAIAQVLQDLLGQDVGHFLSPHVHSYNERILCNSSPISPGALSAIRQDMEALSRSGTVPDQGDLSFFDRSFIEACQAFRNFPIWVVEAGIGAREDVTAILPTHWLVLTRFGLDHLDRLGPDLEAIARQKSAAIIPNRPVISSAQDPKAMEIIQARAQEEGSPLKVFDPGMVSAPGMDDQGDLTFHFQSAWLSGDYRFRMTGLHQVENFGTALLALETILKEELGSDLEGREDQVRQAVQASIYKAKLPGRLEKISEDPLIIIDGAHNPQAARTLLKNLAWMGLLDQEGMNLVFGMHDGKLSQEEKLAFFSHFHRVVEVPTEGVSDEKIIEELAMSLDRVTRDDPNRPILVCGSFYILDGAWRWVQARQQQSS